MIPPNVKMALDYMHNSGIVFYPIDRLEFVCGCTCEIGWVTALYEQGLNFGSCCAEHAEYFKVIQQSWDDPEVLFEFGDMDSLESFRIQFERMVEKDLRLH